MIPKSQAFLDAVNANARMSKFQAEFGFVPPGAVEGATVSGTAAASYADLPQVNDGIIEMGAFWRGLGDWPLDGQTLTPGTPGEYAFWSDDLSSITGELSSCYVDYEMDAAYDLIGVTIYFDLLADEWATQFSIEYYANNVLIDTKIVNDNTSATAVIDFQQQGVDKIRIILREWCLPRARARIAEIMPGQIYVFDNESGYELTATNVMTPWANSFENSELAVEFDNSDHKFDFLNPDGVFAYLRQKMKIKTNIGIAVGGAFDYVKSGDRYLFDIPGNEQLQTARLSCRPSMAFAEGYLDTIPQTTTTIATMAATLWAETGLTETLTIDPSLAALECNAYPGEDVPVTDALALLAIAAGGWWFVDREGNYTLKPIVAAIPNTADAVISYDDMLSKPKITQNPRYTAVRVGWNVWNTGEFRQRTRVIKATPNDGNMIDCISALTPSWARAQVIGQLLLDYHAARPLTFEIEYRGNPALEVGDCVSIETDYGFRNIIITQHNLTLNDSRFLHGSIKGVG